MSKISIKRQKKNIGIHEKIDNLNSIEDIKIFLKEMFSKEDKTIYKHNEIKDSKNNLSGARL